MDDTGILVRDYIYFYGSRQMFYRDSNATYFHEITYNSCAKRSKTYVYAHTSKYFFPLELIHNV